MGETGGAQLLARWRRQQRTPGCSFLPFCFAAPRGEEGLQDFLWGRKIPFLPFSRAWGDVAGTPQLRDRTPIPGNFPGDGGRRGGQAGRGARSAHERQISCCCPGSPAHISSLTGSAARLRATSRCFHSPRGGRIPRGLGGAAGSPPLSQRGRGGPCPAARPGVGPGSLAPLWVMDKSCVVPFSFCPSLSWQLCGRFPLWWHPTGPCCRSPHCPHKPCMR